MTQIEKKGDFLCEDPGSYYVRVFNKIAASDTIFVHNEDVGRYLETNDVKMLPDARNEFLNLAKDDPYDKMYLEEFLTICFGKAPQGAGQKVFHRIAEIASQIYIPETRRGRHLRLLLLDYPICIFGPISVVVVTVVQLITCIQMTTFLAQNPNWTTFGYLRYHTSLSFLSEGHYQLHWFFTGALVEDNPYRLALDLFVNVAYMFPYSFALTFWRYLAVMGTASLGICSLNAVLRTQYYCGGTVTIEAFLWGHWLLVYRNRQEFDKPFVKMLVAPTVSVLNLLITCATAPYKNLDTFLRLLLAHPVGIGSGLTIGYQILKQHGSDGFGFVCYKLYYIIGLTLYSAAYLVHLYPSVFGMMEAEVTRIDWNSSDIADP